MTRISPRTALRRTAGSFAAAGLLAAGSLAVGAPAYAADPVFTLGGSADTALHPYPESGSPQKNALSFTVHNPSTDEENGAFQGEVTYTLDLSGIQGVAVLSPAEDTATDCEITGTTAVCHDHGIWPGLSTAAEFGLSAAKGSKEGATGTIEVTGSAEGATFTPFTTKVTVGGPDLVMKPLPFKTELKPGDAQPAPITFSNQGTTAADGVLLTLHYSRGLDIPERYSNCEYLENTGEPPFQDYAWATALCAVEGTYEPGATYTLGVPLSVEATERALIDSFVYRINEDSPAERSAQRGGAAFTRGTGPQLTLKKATASARGADLDPWNNQQEVDFRTENTADFAATGDRAEGKAGDTVTAKLGYRNDGPAWVGHIRSGESVAGLDFTVPEGAQVTGKPENCRGVTAEGKYREEQLGAPRYLCPSSMTVNDKAEVSLPFELKITEEIANAKGKVTIGSGWVMDPELAFDPEPANNTAYLVLNGDDQGAGSASGGDGDGGSAEGSTGGSTSGSTGGTPSGSPGEGGTSTPGSTGTAGSGSSGGGLASTGSTALMASGAAAVALAAGGVLYAVTRRRARLG
ncbi:peptidase [Streptomyces nitrosporeus]|uniref:peptidase n=1 Tax=Streptomyces nitrosporeus TaxID=28894 RepID=UPI00331BF7B1